MSYAIYLLFGLIFSFLTLKATLLRIDSDNLIEVLDISPLEFIHISVYLGLIIISLELPKFQTDKLESIVLLIAIFLIWLKLENVTFLIFSGYFLVIDFIKFLQN